MNFLKTRQPSVTHSEAVRKRRGQNDVKQPAASRKTAPTGSPRNSTVVNRNTRYATPSRVAVSTQPKRRVYYAVGANGVETRMPALPIIHFSWQWVSGLLTVAFFILALLITTLAEFKVNRINLVGIQRVTAEEISAIVRNNSDSVFTLNKQKSVQDIAQAFPELTNIRLTISMPDGVTISAVERQPILAWKTEEELVWVDAAGVVMTPRGEVGELLTVNSSGILPFAMPVATPTSIVDYAMMVIENTSGGQDEQLNLIDPQILQAAIQLSALMPSGANLVYDSISGIGWRDPAGWRVYFGSDLSNITFKQTEYQVIVDKLAQLGINPVVVSVEYIDSPYYRVE